MSTTTSSQAVTADVWFDRHAEGFLRRIGVRKCQRIADIGCRNGLYTLPAARVAGSCGKVYAVDKEQGPLSTIKEKVQEERQYNVTVVDADLAEAPAAPIADESIDLVLLFDVLHGGYMPEQRQRLTLLNHIGRILVPGGILSCYLTHLRQFGLTFESLLDEIRQAGFRREGDARRRLAHDGKVVRGRVFRFRKPAEKGP